MQNEALDRIDFLDTLQYFGIKANTDQARQNILKFENQYSIKLPNSLQLFLEKIESFELLTTKIVQSDELIVNHEELAKAIRENPTHFPKDIDTFIHIGEEENAGSYYMKKQVEECDEAEVYFHDWENNNMTKICSTFELFLDDIIADSYDFVSDPSNAFDKEEEEYFGELKHYMEKNLADQLNN